MVLQRSGLPISSEKLAAAPVRGREPARERGRPSEVEPARAHIAGRSVGEQSAGGSLEGYATAKSQCTGGTQEDLFRRMGYYDLRAYAQRTSSGLSQGCVLVRHHTLVGTNKKVFYVGNPQQECERALAIALDELNQLARNIENGDFPPLEGNGVPMAPGEQSL